MGLTHNPFFGFLLIDPVNRHLVTPPQKKKKECIERCHADCMPCDTLSWGTPCWLHAWDTLSWGMSCVLVFASLLQLHSHLNSAPESLCSEEDRGMPLRQEFVNSDHSACPKEKTKCTMSRSEWRWTGDTDSGSPEWHIPLWKQLHKSVTENSSIC